MTARRILYRFSQFWKAVFSAPAPEDLKVVSSVLSPEQLSLFRQMQPSEQAHSIQVMYTVLEAINGRTSEHQQDLLAAALLHDVGKNRYPLRLWERVLIVLSRAFNPELVKRWGEEEPTGWRRAFVVSERHPEWGAQMAAAAGASPLTEALIRRHQMLMSVYQGDAEDEYLSILQSADHER
jgi:hypothetical protein